MVLFGLEASQILLVFDVYMFKTLNVGDFTVNTFSTFMYKSY